MEKQESSQIYGLHIERRLCPEGVAPFDTCEWDRRDVTIHEHTGKVVFEQKDCEFPTHFSPLAGQIAASKYFRGRLETDERESSVRQVIGRIVGTLTGWGIVGNYFADREAAKNFQDDLTFIMLHQIACFNSPVLFNLGVPDCEQQASACFIIKAEDTMNGWMRNVREEAMIFKRGSGSGLDLTPVRSSWEHITGGGWASGPISLMKILDTNAGQIKSGGVTRRAAKMHVLSASHPDILETREGAPGFVSCKLDEEKAAHALIDAGYDGGFNVVGGAYQRVFFQNANHSVRAPDSFFQAINRGDSWRTFSRFGVEVHRYKAQEVHRAICEASWACGDPAYQFDGAIQKWHTIPNSGRINASNPCSEFLHPDNTSCNLFSLNLVKFHRPDGQFDHVTFQHVCRIMTLAGEIIVGAADYPTEDIKRETRRCRPLGMGYANLGALLMRMGLAYDSEEGRQLAGAITSLMSATGYAMSADISEFCGGPFEYFGDNKEAMLRVIDLHSHANQTLWDEITRAVRPKNGEPEPRLSEILCYFAAAAWGQAYHTGSMFGFRNSQISVIAPTGTISFWMDCDTTGIEPDLSLIKHKALAGGGSLSFINLSVRSALRALCYPVEAQHGILNYVEENGHLEGCEWLEEQHLPIFDCAFQAPGGTRSIHYMGHIRMMAAVQPFVSGAISKTCNLPNAATVEDVSEVFMTAWKLGLKCVTVYRDGCKRSQPLSAGKGRKKHAIPPALSLKCPSCGTDAQPGQNEKCFACPNCGSQVGCSV